MEQENITRVYETSDWTQANDCMEQGWKLLKIGTTISLEFDQPKTTVYYSLGWSGDPKEVSKFLSLHSPWFPEISDWTKPEES